MSAPFASNALRLSALRRAVVCTAWACVWVAEARTVLRVCKAEQRLDWVARAVQLALIASLVATYLACAFLAFTPRALPSLNDMQRVSSSGPSAEGLAPMTQRPAPGFLVCEALRLLLHVSLSFHPAISADRCTHVPPNINILALEVLCTMRASFLGLDPKQHALAWVFTPFFWFLDYRYASLNALPGCTTVLGHALRRGLAMVACKAFLTGLPVLLLSRDSKAHPCIAASGCLVLLGVQAATSGLRVLNTRSTLVGLWEVWLAHMVALGVGADEGNFAGEMHMQVRRVQRIAEDALPRHVVESLMQEPAEGMLGDFESPPHSHCLKLLSDYENLVQQQQESNLQRLQYLHHDSGHLPGSHHKLQHHRGGHAQHADYAEAAAAAAALQGLSGGFACASPAWHQGEDLYSSPSRCYDWQQQHGQQQQMTLPNVQEELQGGWFETRLPCHHSLTDLKAAAQKSPMRSATRSPCASVLAVVGQQGDAGQGGWRSSGSGPSLRSSGESSTPYYPTTARLSLTGSSGPLAPLPLPRVSVGSASSQSYPGSAHRCSDMADTTYAEHHPDACVLFADIVSYTSISAVTSPLAMVNLLNTLFRKFDQAVAEEPHLYKLDMIGDCYMVASGLHWHASDPYPARTLVDFAKFLLHSTATVLNPVTAEPLQIRVGIHKGPVVGALVGRLRRKYTLLGDVVNTYKRKLQQQREGNDSSASDVSMERSVTLHKLPQVPDAPAAEPTSCCDAFHNAHVSPSLHLSHLSSSQHLTADTLGAWTGSSAAEPAVFSRDSFDDFSFGLNSQGGRSRRASQASQYSARLNLPPAAAQPGPWAPSHKDLHMPGLGGSGSPGAPGTSGALATTRGRSGLEHRSWVGSVALAHLSQARGSWHSQNLDNVDAQDDVVTVWSPHSRVGSGSARLVAASLQGSFDAEAAETSSVEVVASGAGGFDADTPAHRSCDHHDVAAALPGLEAWQYCGETELKGRVATMESYVLQVVQPNVRVHA